MEALPLRRPQSERTCPSFLCAEHGQQRERVGPEWEYLHFLGIMDFLHCLRDWGPVQNNFWTKPRELGADDCDGVVHFVCSAARCVSRNKCATSIPALLRWRRDRLRTFVSPPPPPPPRLAPRVKTPEQKATFVFFAVF